MADGKVKIDTQIDESGVDKGLASMGKKLKDGAKKVDSYVGSLAKVSLVGAGVGLALKKVTDTINDLTAAYKTQIKAETQLESAAKNNPYLDSSSVQVLKDYASEIQSYSTFGDEELLPMMASLAAAGRTQDQIMQIMAAATDMAASGAFSLDGAVRNLNKSYGGLSGELGESIPEIKALTAEQLKNGAATKLMAERYKGIAAETAKATGTQEQLNNSIGDLKEEFGAGFEKGLAPIRKFFTALISGWANAKKEKREYQESTEANAAIETRTASTLEKQLNTEKEKLAQLKIFNETTMITAKEALKLSDEQLAKRYGSRVEVERMIAAEKAELEDQEKLVQLLSTQLGIEKDREKAVKNNAQAMMDEVTKAKAASDYIAANTAAREKALEQLELQAQTEEREVTAEEKLAVYAQSYVSLVAESNGLITAQNQAAVSLLNTTIDISKEVKDQNALREEAATLEENLKLALEAVKAVDDRDESVKMREQLTNLSILFDATISNEQITAEKKAEIWEEYTNKKAILEKQITLTEEEEAKARAQKSREHTIELLTIANDFATEYQNLMTSISALANQMIDDEAKIKTEKLDKQYEDGEISLQEYEDKKSEIEKKAAKERYKVQMWEWTAQIATAVANTALGVTKALEMGLPGIVIGALIGAAGAVQLATILGSKPIPPSFATGGILGGTSYTGDQNVALLNSREMILNAGQQRNLFDSINSGRLGGANVKIYNNAANDVHARATVTEDGIKVVINKTVAQAMKDGKYNDSYRTMQNGLNGIRLTN